MATHFVSCSFCRAAWALAVYRQTRGAGIVPTVESLSQLLGCLRTPEVPEPNYFDDRVVAFLGQSWPASPRHVVDGCGVYDPRALALFEVCFSFLVFLTEERFPLCYKDVTFLEYRQQVFPDSTKTPQFWRLRSLTCYEVMA